MDCQLTGIGEMEHPNARLDDLLQARLRLLRMGKRKLVYRGNRLIDKLTGRQKGLPRDSVTLPEFQEGELVRVKSKEQIEATLDDAHKFRGVLFIDEQFEYCDKELRVLRVVNSFFDEARQRVVRSKNTVLLDGSRCSGRQRLYSYACDRNCFFFWNAAWLVKISGEPTDAEPTLLSGADRPSLA